MHTEKSASVRNRAWDDIPRSNGIFYLSDPREYAGKEELYIKVRKKENRIYDDRLVKKLPLIEKTDHHFKEWEIRLISVMRLHKHLLDQRKTQKMLDLGCGNGWMSNLMSEVYDSRVFGVDLNETELQQATRLFGDNSLLTFAYGDIMKEGLPERDFDVIIIAATVQYFPNLKALIDLLMTYLAPGGVIHIIDSPFYTKEAIAAARQRTANYYASLGFPEMAAYYHHHPLEVFNKYETTIYYDPRSPLNKVRRKILTASDSPFPWVVIRKQ